ncbi:pentapeptide repeat-containing protein [Streptomyces lincolnensis]|uniref:pentapeptide repeat-containing protein n=1 Tax=Streptomyces lincolnensis TaxID=1915 RepID=UPI0037D1A77E
MSDEQQPTTGRRPWWIWAAATTGAILFIAALIWGPWWIEGDHLYDNKDRLVPSAGIIVTGFRTMLVAIGAGTLAGAGLWYTHRSHRHAEKLYEHAQEQFAHAREKDREQAELTREGQVTDRYVEAIKLLSSDNVTQRLGGIYSLERIMRDSARDHRTVLEVLAAFVRTRAAKDPKSAGDPPVQKVDVHAALTVIGRRPRQSAWPLQLRNLDLSWVDLRGYELHGLDFDMTTFDHSDMAGCQLAGSSFERSSLKSVSLRGANMFFARFYRTVLSQADLSRAILSHANMPQTYVHEAKFEQANLAGAYAASVRGLQYDQVDSCLYDDTTQWPEGIVDWLKTRAAEEAAGSSEVEPPATS